MKRGEHVVIVECPNRSIKVVSSCRPPRRLSLLHLKRQEALWLEH